MSRLKSWLVCAFYVLIIVAVVASCGANWLTLRRASQPAIGRSV